MLEFLTVGLTSLLVASDTLWASWANPSFDFTICSVDGRIYTVNETQPTVDCLAIKQGRIADTQSYSEALQQHSSWYSWLSRRKISLVESNSIIVPGLADAHAHIVENGFKMQLPLDSATSLEEVLMLVKAYILKRPDLYDDRTRWVEGMGWDQTRWVGQNGSFPTADDLDSDPILKGRPIALRRVDGHGVWASPKALSLAGDLPDKVAGGEIIRDPSGNPTGVFLDNAMNLIFSIIPAWDEKQIGEFLDATIFEALSKGLTSIHDAATELPMISVLRKRAEEGTLPLRTYLMGWVDSTEYWGNKLPRLINHGKQGRLNLRAIKIFTDGALGSWGAALLEPYSDKPETSGIMRGTPSQLKEFVNQFCLDGWQVNIHCIGDRANHVILDIYEDVLGNSTVSVNNWRPRIEHAQIMTQDDLKRIGKLGVIASIQPTHATSDMWYAETRLGPERIKGAYAYQSLLEVSQKGVLPLGSDFPVESVNPLFGFYAAVSRLSRDGTSPHGAQGWYGEQRLTRAQALKGMTLDAAYASFAEKEIGSLDIGKKADFVVLDRDIMTVPVSQILQTKVTATIVDGEIVYGAL